MDPVLCQPSPVKQPLRVWSYSSYSDMMWASSTLLTTSIHTFYLIVQVIFVLCYKHYGSSSDTEIKIGTWFTGLGVSTSMILPKTNLTRANWSESKVYVWGLLTKFDPLVRVWTLTNWGFLSAGVIRWAYKKKNCKQYFTIIWYPRGHFIPNFQP